MVYYDTDSRLQFAREQAERLADEMRRTRRLAPEEGGHPSWISFGRALARRVERLLRRKGHHVPAYGA